MVKFNIILLLSFIFFVILLIVFISDKLYTYKIYKVYIVYYYQIDLNMLL